MPPRSTRSGLRKDVGQVVAQQGRGPRTMRRRGRCTITDAIRLSGLGVPLLFLGGRQAAEQLSRVRSRPGVAQARRGWALLIILKAPPLRIIVALASAAR